MPTFNQLVRKGRQVSEKKAKAPALLRGWNSQKNRPIEQTSPQKRGVCTSVNVEAKTVNAHIPTWQEAKTKSYHPNAAIAIAYTEDNTLAFKNATALLKFTVKNDNVKSVTFYGNKEEAVSGNVLISLADKNNKIESVVGQETSNFGFEPASDKVYLIPSDEWKTASATFGAYFFGNGEKWKEVKDENNDGIYEVDIPEGFKTVIFCRMKPGTTGLSWDNKDKQTADLSLAEGKVYTVEGWDGGRWEANTPALRTYVELYALDALEVNTEYYMAIAPQTFAEGFAVQLEINGEKHTVKELKTLYTISPNMILNIGVLEYTASVEPEPDDNNLYLKPNSNWTQANARFAAYFFNNSTNKNEWVNMVDSDSDGIYEVEKKPEYPNVIFCRMNPSSTTNGWTQDTQKWNQTGDLVIPTNGNNLYTVKDGTWDKGGGTWSKKQ